MRNVPPAARWNSMNQLSAVFEIFVQFVMTAHMQKLVDFMMAKNTSKNRWIFLIFGIFLFVVEADIVSRCGETCQSTLAGRGGTERLACNETCRSNACVSGCSIWDNTTAEACKTQCQSLFLLETQVQYCYTGCLNAEYEYATAVEAEVGIPTAPFVVSMESITNDSVDIGWASADHMGVSYTLQWRYANIQGSTWTSYHKQPITTLQSSVTGLHPFVTYAFRVQWVITPRRRRLNSPSSQNVTTDPYGPPLSPPIIMNVFSPSPTTISVTWKPPNFPSGPIIEHTVSVENAAGFKLIVGVTSNSYTFVRLESGTLYTVTVESRNAEGMSPGAIQNITTQPALNDTGVDPFLVVGVTALDFMTLSRGSFVSFLPLEDFSIAPSDLHIVDVENTTIIDVAVHYWKQFLYLSDSSGTIHRRSVDVADLNTWNTSSDVIYNSTKVATLLTVDWLFDHLYFAQENQVLRCDLSCSQAADVVISGMDSPPTELHVDPYNGFIYWSELGQSRGIYRLDLAQLGGNAYNQKELIISLEDIETFLIDPTGFQVIFPNASQDSLISSFLDGTEQGPLRVDDGHVLEYFTNVSSLAYYNNLFVWTRYDDIVKTCDLSTGEAYNAAYMYFEAISDTIMENTHFFCSESFHGLDIYHPRYQPIPAPATPPTKLQVLFSDSTAEVSWIRPVNLESTGQGAWQEWTYEIELTDTTFSDTTIVDSIQGLTFHPENLTTETEYSIRVRGYSQTTKGPWSRNFVGRTLKNVTEEPYLIFASSDAIKRISLDGTGLMDIVNHTDVRDFAWNADALYWCNGRGEVFMTNLSEPQIRVTQFPFTSYTQALAVDWFTGQLYRGNSDQQDLAIDSRYAYMYWTTSETVECSRLTGEGHFVYERISDISDDRIAGLTLDLGGGFVYWLSLTSDDSVQSLRLFRSMLAGIGMVDPVSTKEEISVIPSNTEKFALTFYSQKLFWIDEQDEIVVGNVEGSSIAKLHPVQGANAIEIIQSTLQTLPDGFSTVPNVVPSAIPADSIQIVGPWHNFNITWSSSNEVEYGTVFYDISVTVDGAVSTTVVKNAVYNVVGSNPFQPLLISIQAYTYWGTAGTTTATRMSPMSVPSIPQNPRAFVTESTDIYTDARDYMATFRWDSVAVVNGILLGYKVHWGTSVDELMMRTVGNETREFVVGGLASNSTYFFQVEGFTSIGSGPATEFVNILTNSPSPPPILFSIGASGITQIDTDTQTSNSLLNGETISPTAVAFIARDEILFWADRTKGMVKSSKFDGSNEQNLFPIQQDDLPQATGLAVDWLSRSVYVAANDKIIKYDTTLPADRAMTRIAQFSATVDSFHGVVVDPLKSRLFWTEQRINGTTFLMTSDLQGQNPRPFLGSSGSPANRSKRQACSCPPDMTVSGAVAIDQTDATNPELFFVDGVTGDIVASDLDGCQCRLAVVASEHAQSGLPPNSLTVDHTRVYWSNNNQGIVASADKATGLDFRSEIANEVPILVAFGNNLQPYPDPICLTPQPYQSQAQLVSRTSDTLNLALTPAEGDPQCAEISLSLVTYTVLYGKVDTATLSLTKTSTDTTVVLDNLDPHTEYTVRVSSQNYYTRGEPVLGPGIVHMTGVGAPSKAQIIDVIILDPNMAVVRWRRPSQPNGPIETLRYRIRYNHYMDSQAKIFKQSVAPNENSSALEFEDNVTMLTGGQEYTFQVEAYHQSNNLSSLSSLSQSVTMTTFQVPNRVTVISRSDKTINVTWTSPSDDKVSMHRMEYLYAGNRGLSRAVTDNKGSKAWTQLDMVNNTEPSTKYPTLLTNLVPHSFYHIRAYVVYVTGRSYDYAGDNVRIVTDLTEAGLPEAPPPPEILGKNPGFEVRWTKPSVNGPETGFKYRLQILQERSGQAQWKTVYEGTDTSWEAVDLTDGESYTFKVAGKSIIGIGPYSATSQPQVYMIGAADDVLIIYIVAAVVFVLLLLAILVIIIILRKRAQNNAKWKHDVTVAYRADTELATLRQYPTMIVQKDNSLYAVTTTIDGKETELPMFPRERLKLITFLGSGAFGEVFEGLALNISGPDSGETRVAVKTLKQGATDQEKEEFLKEAALMGNFHDKNIIALLGVCLDNDPQFIILELMDGGDLLSYLRGARGTSITPCRLSPLDLIDIVIDVAKGCRYLESLKFVHRDLAARNCLVSTKDYACPDRIVKIGDFGLARDIYKNDYYRKEGEGLLPVRWMSPEALMDGLFAVQSDVWSFGVLVWEVMTLGQQPYPARTNVEVLHYVGSGGRLDRPDNCPDDIHHLMLKCWEKQPEGRPSFHNNLEKLNSYRRKSSSMSSGVDNPAFDRDSVKYLRLGGPSASGSEDYLQPMDSAQSLGLGSSTDSLSELKAKAQEDARQYLENQDQYNTQGAKPKPPRTNRDSLVVSPGHADLEPRYTAAPSSFSKATGANVTKPGGAEDSNAPRPKKPLNMRGSWVDPEKKEKRQQKQALKKKKQEEIEERRQKEKSDPTQSQGVVNMEEPHLVSKPSEDNIPPPMRRAPNPFRQDSGDEAERSDYTNWPKHIEEDRSIYHV